jgi:hypothetical protein
MDVSVCDSNIIGSIPITGLVNLGKSFYFSCQVCWMRPISRTEVFEKNQKKHFPPENG